MLAMPDSVPEGTGPLPVEDREGLRDAHAVLVLARDPSRSGGIVGALQARGIPAVQANAPREAFFWLRTIPPTVALADLSMQGAGIFVRELLAQGRTVVALSDDPARRQTALEAGCVEAHHLTDAPSELSLHIATLLRRRDVQRIGLIRAGALEVDLTRSRLIFGGIERRARPRTLNLAAHLAIRSGRIVPATVLQQEVWGDWFGGPTDKVHLGVHRLRRCLGLPANSDFLQTRRGYGYGIFPEAPLSDPPLG